MENLKTGCLYVEKLPFHESGRMYPTIVNLYNYSLSRQGNSGTQSQINSILFEVFKLPMGYLLLQCLLYIVNDCVAIYFATNFLVDIKTVLALW